MELIPIDASFLQRDDVIASGLIFDVCRAILQLHGRTGARFPWLGYLAEAHRDIVGACAFKGPPLEGRVEIGYYAFPGHQGRGYGTEMAAALVARAKAHDPALVVVAYTLLPDNASARILDKLGFACRGSVTHPQDGLVWEWELH